MKAYYSLTEAAKILGYASGGVLKFYIHKGLVKGTKFGRNWVISHTELKKRAETIKRNIDRKQGKKPSTTATHS